MSDSDPPARRWALLATALAGRPLQVRPVRRACPAWAGSDAAEVVDLPAQGSDDAWRLAVLRHALDLQPGGRWTFRLDEAQARGLATDSASPSSLASDVERCLAGWPRPVLLRRLWFVLDRRRVDAQIRRDFPGARGALPLPLETSPAWPAALQAMVQGGTDAGATVYDSLRAALAWCAWLEAARPERHRRRTDAAWTLTDTAGDGGPAGARGGGPGRAGEGPLADAADGATQVDAAEAAPTHPARAGQTGAASAAPGSAVARERRPAAAPGAAQAGPATPARPTPLAAQRHRHDEWDYHLQRYRRAWTCVHERRLPASDPGFLADLRQRHAALSRQIRRRFSSARPAWRDRVRGSPEGDQIDLDAAIGQAVDRRAGHRGDGHVYIAHPLARRDVCVALLLDTSGSTGYAIPDPVADAAEAAADSDEDFFFHAAPRRALPPPRPRRRVIDVARDAIGLMCEGLHGLGDRHAVFGFTGQGREQVDFHVAKPFDSAWSAHSAALLSALQPGGATRTGAAIRHALLHLAREPARRKVLIVVTDGYPQDSDYGPDPADIDYGLHDTARALHEAARAGVAAFCISIDGAAHDHLRRMCPPQRYLVIDDVDDLPQRLVAVYRRLTVG